MLKQRRRQQLRTAQSKFRRRKAIQALGLQDRIAQLETTVDKVALSMASLGNDLIRSGVLDQHQSIKQRLEETLQTCVSSLQQKQHGEDDDDDMRPLHGNTQVFPVPRLPFAHFSPPSDLLLNRATAAKCVLTDVEICISHVDFLDMLHTSIIYHGYFALASPSVSMTKLRQHFWPALSIMDRQRVAIYFAALFHGKISKQKLDQSGPNMPFFQLGGAGTHYIGEGSFVPVMPKHRSPEFPTVVLSAADVPDSIERNFNGDWFDMLDLELFLKERNISFYTGVNTGHYKKKKTRPLPAGAIRIQEFIGGKLKDPSVNFQSFYNAHTTNISPTTYSISEHLCMPRPIGGL